MGRGLRRLRRRIKDCASPFVFAQVDGSGVWWGVVGILDVDIDYYVQLRLRR